MPKVVIALKEDKKQKEKPKIFERGTIVRPKQEFSKEVASYIGPHRVSKIFYYKVSGTSSYHTDADYRVHGYSAAGICIVDTYVPQKFFEIFPDEELAKAIKQASWFKMYRGLSVKEHPYTRIFK